MPRRLPSTDDLRQVRGRSPLVRVCARLADAPAFNLAIFAVILANAVVLGAETYEGARDQAGGLLEALNTAFLAVFVVELAIRLTAYGSRPGGFFRSGWNVFDLVVVLASLVPGLNATLLRLLRLGRVLRVVRLLPDLRVLTVAIGRSLPGVVSLTILAVLVIFVYGMVGWTIFEDHAPDQYGTIGEAMLTLFVTLTLENFPAQLELGRELSDWTLVYFISYALVAAFLLFNILIGVVINSLEEARAIEARRELRERREAAARTPGERDDHEVTLDERVAALRGALDALETELGARRR